MISGGDFRFSARFVPTSVACEAAGSDRPECVNLFCTSLPKARSELTCYAFYTNIGYKLVYGDGCMSKNTSVTLGQHFDGFIAQQIDQGRYASASEVIRAGLRMLEDNEQKIATLRYLLEEGEKSGTAEYSYESLIQELDNEPG